jgi:branched-chain amino acid transport system permease protein
MTRDWKWWAWRVGAVVVLGTILLVLPQQYQAFRVNQFNLVITYAIAALGLNLLTGYNGQISVGHGAFYGVGAYTTVILVADYGWPYFGTVAMAAVITFLLGMLVGLPALRIHGLYLALVTLALATVFPQIIVRFSDFTGGFQGKRIPRGDAFVAPGWTGLADDQWRYYVLLTFAVVAFVLVRNLVRSRAGRAIIAIRDNPTAAATLGINVSAYKVLVFGVSAMLAGVAGSLSTFYSPFVSSGQYNINLSIFILVAVVVGGASTIMGPAVGAFLVVFVPIWLDDFDAPAELSPIVFGASLILLIMVAPGGILGLVRRLTAWVKRRTTRQKVGPPPAETAEPLASTS